MLLEIWLYTDMPKVPAWEPSMPNSPKKLPRSTETSTIHSPPRRACKFPTTSPHWPATLAAIQNDDQEKLLALLQDMKIDLNYNTDQVIMNVRTHISATK